MGCHCGSVAKSDDNLIKETLSDSIRYCAYLLPCPKPDYVLIYDFQCFESRVVHLLLDPPLAEYSVAMNYPFLFVAGGVEKETNKVSNKIWATSAGSDEVSMSKSKLLSEARKRLFLISGKEDNVYAIGGLTESDQQSKVCEKFEPGKDSLTKLPSISIDYDQIVGTKKYIFAFKRHDSRQIVESLDMNKEHQGWISIVIKSSNSNELPIKYLDSFGVFSENESSSKLIIFGGQEDYSEVQKQVFILDVKMSKLEATRNNLPEPAKFLLPVTETEKTGFALSESYKLFIYDKKKQSWKVRNSNIKSELVKKN